MRFESQFSRINCHTFFNRIKLRTLGRQRQQGDVCLDGELIGQMPSGLIEHEHGMSAWRDLAADLGQVHVHGLAVSGA